MSITMSILKVICAFLFLLIASFGAEARHLLDTYGRTSPTREVSTTPAAGKLQDDDNLLLMVTSDPWGQKKITSNCDSGETCSDNQLGRPPAGRSPPAPKPEDPWEQKIINSCDGGRKTCSNNNNIKNKYERPGKPSPPPPKSDDPWEQMIINACDGRRKTCTKLSITLKSLT